MAAVRCTSEVTGERVEASRTTRAVHGELDAGRAKAWLTGVPDDAALQAIMWDRGSQRDPEPYLHGLRAVWTEDR